MTLMEATLCEDYIIKELNKLGWIIVRAESLERENYDEPLLIPNLVRALERINEKAGIGGEEIHKAINELLLIRTGPLGAMRILNLYKFGVPVKFEKEKVVNYVELFDFENIKNNECLLTNQVYYHGREMIRTDLVLYVNGIPLVNIECKDPSNLAESWLNAYKQIKNYEKTVPELYKYMQIGVAAETVAKYFPIVPWQEEVNSYEWKEEGMDSIDSAIAMLSPATLLDMIKNFIFYREEHGNATKVIARYMQYRAANKMVERVITNLKGKEEKNKGLIWHWQGSGKTLTMIFAAQKLFFARELENPSIFFIVDRIELEQQLSDEFNYLEIMEHEVIGSVADLKFIVRSDDYRGKRGVFITLVHKFRPEEFRNLQNEIETISRRKSTIMNRKNIVAFIDEGHRSQYGTLAAQMKAILKNAFAFAMTGTPISKKGRDTYLEFSYPPEEPYLDKYFITDSIKEGFTLKIVYQPRLEKDVHLNREELEVFLESEFEEIPEEIQEHVKEAVRRKINIIKAYLENPQRIQKIAQDIAEHFKETIDGKFKAIVVAGSRKACDIYKKELDKHLPSAYSKIAMTYNVRTDEGEMLKYVAEERERYGGMMMDDIRKDVIEKFKEADEMPRILIVTDMLLAGFDAPILQVMYLDKLLKEHRLLQAVARTNRPYKNVKEAGVIIDYVGILGEFKRALQIYSEADIKGALFSYDNLRVEFIELLSRINDILKDIPHNYVRGTFTTALEKITIDKAKEKEFIQLYESLRNKFELLSSDPGKLEHLENYKWISRIYSYYCKMVLHRSDYDAEIEKYYRQTIQFVHKATEIDKIEKNLPVISFDEQYLDAYLKALEEKLHNKKEKAANIIFTLNKLVLVERHKNPIYETLVEKVERLLEMWRESKKDYERIYKEGFKILNDIRELSEKKRTLGLKDLEYALFLAVQENVKDENELLAEIKELSKQIGHHMFPGWFNQATVEKNIMQEIRKFVRRIKKKHGLSIEEMDTLYKKLVERVKNYGTTGYSV
ncbi:MAG: hypothetical protein A2Y62_16015 [Candidatus Fischerbacteria bacterium RBG_13_37_8]|uniref:Type I restriction enzyme endonuclease subunit n=1 Tax=Candidatus Fischerbacteria bacterium RBG_13_37_8 TaxID=1817863 RepID=A0A1F5VXU1_9BACT|nr:MAG: hypothetical protein A2Y62_16015 [Candidatus Fischerbacteria bacterium RBG_13_37_8]